MDTSNIVIGAMALLGTALGGAAGAWKVRRVQRSADTNASYDQIQEDLKAMREERRADREAAIWEREKDRATMAYFQELVMHLDNEVVGLRNDIQTGAVPPLPPRLPWPQRFSPTDHPMRRRDDLEGI